MEQVLDIYKRPYNERNPVICSDESPKQLIAEIRTPIPMKPGKGKERKVDSEYIRNGVCNIFMMVEPLVGKRQVKVTDRRTKKDWAEWIKEIVDAHYPNAELITLIQDNLNTHKPAVLYEYYSPVEAKRLIDKIDFKFTPKHGSWLDMAEIELNVLHGQCLKERMEGKEQVEKAVNAWQSDRNNKSKGVKWQFSTEDARIKLRHLYPTILT
jgi:hypothetical protein